MLTATESFHRVRKSVTPHDDCLRLRFGAGAEVGAVLRHGDLYFTKMAAVPAGAKLIEKPDPQLAPGTTQGSRHILDSLHGVKVYAVANPTPLDGPVLDVATERTVGHPEHKPIVLEPGVYACTHQRAYAQELRRVAD